MSKKGPSLKRDNFGGLSQENVTTLSGDQPTPGVIPHKGDLSRVRGPLQSQHPGSTQGEKKGVHRRGRSQKGEAASDPQSGMVWSPPSSLSKRLKPIRGPVRPERALSKGTVLPGSKPKREAPGNTGEHPRIRRLLGSRATGRVGCELGAGRAPSCKPSLGHQVMNVCTP